MHGTVGIRIASNGAATDFELRRIEAGAVAPTPRSRRRSSPGRAECVCRRAGRIRRCDRATACESNTPRPPRNPPARKYSACRSNIGIGTSTTRAPASISVASAASNAAATAGSRSSSTLERGSINRRPAASSVVSVVCEGPPPAPHRTQRTPPTDRHKGPHRIERVRQRKCTVARNAPCRRFESRYAAQRRRHAHRSARVGAERHRTHVVGDRDGGARRRTARDAARRAVERILRRAVVRIRADDAERELDHVRAADDDGAGRAQSRHRGRVAYSGCSIGQDLRSRPRDVAADIEQVLHETGRPSIGERTMPARRNRSE